MLAYKTGKITEISETGGSPGGRIAIDHGGGIVTKYLHHVPRSDLKVGDTVYGGQKIADLLQYYDANGTEMTHLHFEMYKDGKNIDPTQYVRDAKNTISSPMTDAKAKQEHEKLVPPDPQARRPVTPPGGEPPVGPQENDREKTLRIDNRLKHIRKTRAGLTDITSRMQEYFAPIVKERRSSKDEEFFPVPGVGNIRYFNNGFIKKYTYFDENGNQFENAAEFMEAVDKENQRLEKLQEKLMDERPTQLSSASTQPEVLRASAIVSANDRQSQLQPAIVTMPIQDSQQSSGSNQPILASSMTGASGDTITPGWLLNSVLS